MINQREIAVKALQEILTDGGYNNIVLRKTLNNYNDLTASQKAFITEVVNGTLRNLIHMDYIISQFSKAKKVKPYVQNLLRISTYQLFYMTKTPESAVVNEAVNLIKAKSFKNLAPFVNGVLRNIARNKENINYPKDFKQNLSIATSMPLWLVDYLARTLDNEKLEKFCRASLLAPKVSICANNIKISDKDLVERLKSEGLAIDDSSGSILASKTSSIADSSAFKAGLYFIIDKNAKKAVDMLNPTPNSVVYDICAAPGGKSFYMAQLMENKGSIFSTDIHPHKTKLIENTARKLGIDIIKVAASDMSINYEHRNNKADFVLLDVPCSGFGTLRKKPDVKYTKTLKDVEQLQAIQKNLMLACAEYPKIGGKLLYCTCTISEEENEKNLEWFLGKFNYELEKKSIFSPEDGDGFFAALLVRKG